MLFWISARFGWRALFVLIGAMGMAFALAWWVLYHDPPISGSHGRNSTPISWKQLRGLLRSRRIWGASLGQFGGNSTLVFFLTWFPSYLAKQRNMDSYHAGVFTAVPYLAAAAGVILGGWASDAVLQRTGSRNLARKVPIVFGLFGASTIILADSVRGNLAMTAIFSLAFFCQGMTGLGWAVVADIAPSDLAGLTGGIFNFAANVAGVLTPIVIGGIIAATGSFHYALAYIGGAALLGAGSYVFLLGDIERIVLD